MNFFFKNLSPGGYVTDRRSRSIIMTCNSNVLYLIFLLSSKNLPSQKPLRLMSKVFTDEYSCLKVNQQRNNGHV